MPLLYAPDSSSPTAPQNDRKGLRLLRNWRFPLLITCAPHGSGAPKKLGITLTLTLSLQGRGDKRARQGFFDQQPVFLTGPVLLRNLKTYQFRHSGESRNLEDPWNDDVYLLNHHAKHKFLLSSIPPGVVCLFSQ